MLLTTGGGGEGCGTATHAAAFGLGMVSGGIGETTQITVLVPDGVSSVTFETRTTSRSVAVVNNVAALASHDLTGARYTLPDGSKHTIAVRRPRASANTANP
jgi:hypothetical protein